MSVTGAEHLPLACQHVVEGELRCSAQRLLIARLAANGDDTASAEALLSAFEDALAQMRAHLRSLQPSPTPMTNALFTAGETGSTSMSRSAAWKATHVELSRQITELKMLSAAQAITVAALARAGGDTSEARQHLFEQLDELNALRRQRAVVERFAQMER